MADSKRLAPPYSVVVISDSGGGKVLDAMRGQLIVATNSCVAVGCLSEVDGETEFVLGVSSEVNPGEPPTFEGKLGTPSRRLEISSVLGDLILVTTVPQYETLVRIWVNDPKEPDRVIVGIE
ncbi:MAG: hypothetical protein JWL65_6221 [Gammaproteobacteria bacterium]|nr:hypothetical protein [Gammaproteobacteria bacterium]